MKAQELRIGNYVYNGFNDITKISSIICQYNTSGYLLETLKPIPLTEEILLKCGFEKTYFENIPYFEKGCLTIDGCFYDVELMDSTKLNIIHLHQLQNLYFALTGQELNIEL
jgi:hypothetical protein